MTGLAGGGPETYEQALDGALGDEIEAAMAARELDGEPWWADRFGDLVAGERGRG